MVLPVDYFVSYNSFVSTRSLRTSTTTYRTMKISKLEKKIDKLRIKQMEVTKKLGKLNMKLAARQRIIISGFKR